nr:prepilin peptidase [Vibrio albus]
MWLILFSLLMLLVIYSDLRYRIISNALVMVTSLMVLVYCYQADVLSQWLYAIPVFGIGFLLWWLGVFGAGDVKLLAVLVPAIDPAYHLFTFLMIAFSGGIVAIATLLYAKLVTKNNDTTVPYGISIALGCWLGILASLS